MKLNMTENILLFIYDTTMTVDIISKNTNFKIT